MALQATLFRFKISLSDIDRGLYETLDLRLAQHPSETSVYLLTRLLAYILNFQQDIEFSAQGLGNPDDAPISVADPRGGKLLWLEVGNPSVKRLHMASKSSRELRVYAYKHTTAWLAELASSEIFQFAQIQICTFSQDFLQRLSQQIDKNNDWNVVVQDGNISVTTKNDFLDSPIISLK